MTQLAVILFWVLLGLVVGQGVLLVGHIIALRRVPPPPIEDSACPKTAVILCVRGADPFLDDCLQGLLSLDYPDYTAHIVVDSREDPAWDVVNRAVGEASHVHVSPLTERRPTCSLKASGIQQAIGTLDDSYQAIAVLDSDTIPHAAWLRELVAPLAEPRVGVSSGNRWYMPLESTWGSLIRYCWNAAAVVQMHWYGIGWGGSLVFKASLLAETDLPECLNNAFSDDTAICGCVRRHGYRISHVTSCTMVNREICTTRGFFDFLQRQLLAVRLHHGWWGAVISHGLLTTAALALSWGLCLATLILRNWEALTWLLAGQAMYLGAMIAMSLALEDSMRRIIRRRGGQTDWLRPADYVRLVIAILLTQVVYAGGLILAMFTRNHRWRGVLYRFGGATPVSMVEDRPFEAGDEEGGIVSV